MAVRPPFLADRHEKGWQIAFFSVLCTAARGVAVSYKVLFATSEFEDFVRAGGLASVSAALPRELRTLCDIRVVIPAYRSLLAAVSEIEVVGTCPPLADLPACVIGLTRTKDGLPVYLVICPQLYDREGSPYGAENGVDWPDNDIRFARLSSAAAEIAAGKADGNWSADLIHVNDWPTALAPAYLEWSGRRLPSLLTIHNLAYQGLFDHRTMERIGAPSAAFNIDQLEFYGKVSFLKGGIVHASHLTTVSQTYSREITTKEYGCGLQDLLRLKAERNQLTGILNGIDETWNSHQCADLASPFGVGDWDAKEHNSQAVRQEFGLPMSRGPLFGLVARLVHQKGIDLVLSTAEAIVAAGGQLIVSGRGEEAFERKLEETSRRFPGSIAVKLGFEDGAARRIFAGSDFTLMPSRFEPCGLSQMYAQRFGSLPIGHATGGLAETIEDGKTGFLFKSASVESFLGALCRAFSTYGTKAELNLMRHAAMARIFSWRASANNYFDLYGRAAHS
jgi:starch synthase